MIDTETEDLVSTPEVADAVAARRFGRPRVLITVIAVLALSAILLANKGLIVAGVVDGRPIFRWQLDKTLMNRYGQQTLEGMVSEELIAGEARKQGVKITQSEITAKQDEILKSLGGNVKLEDLLKYQGITKADFDNQIKLQLTVQKILGKNVEVSETDIDNYIASNSATLTATNPGELRKEAKQAILDQKVGALIQPWFTELKAKAKILRFVP